MMTDEETRSGLAPVDVPADPPEDPDDIEADAADDEDADCAAT
jgi:hypothetical protein